MMGMHSRKLSIITIVIATALLIYGFIDAQSYRSGYVSGYSKLARSVEAACAKGDVLDAGLCVAMENALYGAGSDGTGIYAASVLETVGAASPASAISARAKKKLRRGRPSAARASATQIAPAAGGGAETAFDASVSVTARNDGPSLVQKVSEGLAQVGDPAPLTEPAVPPPPTRAQIAAAADCSKSMDSMDACVAQDPWCRWGMLTNAGAFVRTDGKFGGNGCTSTSLKDSAGFGDADGPCAKVKDRLPGAYKYSAGGKDICVAGDKMRFMHLAGGMVLGSETISTSELLRVPEFRPFAQSVGATIVAVPVALPLCSTFMGSSRPMMPGTCTPDPMPSGMMMGGCGPGQTMQGGRCQSAAVSSKSFFANVFDALHNLLVRMAR